jgi:hypothetical protein
MTFSGLAKVSIFKTNVDAENQTLINHKAVFGTRNPAFWVGAVTSSAFSSVVAVFVHFTAVFGALALWLFWIFLALVCALEKNTNVPPKALAIPLMFYCFGYSRPLHNKEYCSVRLLSLMC